MLYKELKISQPLIEKTSTFIRKNWQSTVRYTPDDSDTIIGLPHLYTVPSIQESFQELYYWDTYYTNTGLIDHGRKDLAKSNTDNCLYLANRFGYVPNGNRTGYLSRSQPPHLSMMVREVFQNTQDAEWLAACVPILKKEYDFWMTRRITPIGLNRYFHNGTAKDLLNTFEYVTTKRFSLESKNEEDRIEIGSHLIAECESGWDFTPRFERKCAHFCPVDLNANLFWYEKNFSDFSAILATGEESIWNERAMKRQALINEFLWDDERQCYFDYDFIESRRGSMVSAAIFYPLWAGCATDAQAQGVKKHLAVLEKMYGLAVCEDSDQPITYQWDSPNAWAPLHFACVKGLYKYGFEVDASRIARKYVALVSNEFERTGNLWEKYNCLSGTSEAASEYGTPSLMGWTAGVFIAFVKLLFAKNE